MALLSYSLWQSRFGGSPDALHRQIAFDRRKLEIVGVMGPQGFPAEADVFVSFTWINPETLGRNSANWTWSAGCVRASPWRRRKEIWKPSPRTWAARIP